MYACYWSVSNQVSFSSTHVCTYTHACIHTYIRTCAHTHTHTHTHIQIHIHIHSSSKKKLSYFSSQLSRWDFLTSPCGHLTSFSQSGILKPTVADKDTGHMFRFFKGFCFLKAAATFVEIVLNKQTNKHRFLLQWLLLQQRT